MNLYRYVCKPYVYYVISTNPLYNNKENILISLLGISNPYINENTDNCIEFGPYPSLESPWGTNAKSICHKSGLTDIIRIERANMVHKEIFKSDMIDNMIECMYDNMSADDFIKNNKDDINYSVIYNYSDIDSIKRYITNINNIHNLGFDDQDIIYYSSVFSKMERLPSLIELYDISQSNSEHSRHWFFNGDLYFNGKQLPSLFSMITGTQKYGENNSIIAFKDNSSAIEGFNIHTIIPNNKYREIDVKYNITFTAETHNFPTGIAPFQGATTGTGGRIRDQNSTGKGSLVVAGTAGYCVGNLDHGKFKTKNKRTLLLASDGASDYGNKFGEPVINGFCRAFGKCINDQHIEWVKPIMFSGGIGQMDSRHTFKEKPKKGDLIVKIGGPAYKIGMGGGSASSRGQDVTNINDDLNAVQRGDPQMENKMNRVVRRCVEMGINNPILSIHDQGAGGTANVTKEIMDNIGGDVYLGNITKGDSNMDSLELWISEYQESDTILVDKHNLNIIKYICERENVSIDVIGNIRETGYAKVFDSNMNIIADIPLEDIVTPKYNKIYNITQNKQKYVCDAHSDSIGEYPIIDMLEKVLYNPSVSSKRFLTNKVDRSVTGLVAQQQCVGPTQTPLSDYGIIAQSHFCVSGAVTANGERPLLSLADPCKMARIAVGEMLTNIMFAKITKLEDIKCSGNWMWPANYDGERYNIYLACRSMCNMMLELGIALDGGKDSLSMSYNDTDNGDNIRSPGSLVISGYAPMPDIRNKITPDFKQADNDIIFIDLSICTDKGYNMGYSILYQEYDINNVSVPDANINLIKKTFNKIQLYLEEDDIIFSGHDRSDGGLITALCEMCFAGNLGCDITINDKDPLGFLFNEGLGVVIEVNNKYTNFLLSTFSGYSYYLGNTIKDNKILIKNKNEYILNEKMTDLKLLWEKRSSELEIEQCNPECAKEEYDGFTNINNPKYIPPSINIHELYNTDNHKNYNVAIIREEGSNGDREMASAFHICGFNVYDICMNDLITMQYENLDKFRGIVFVGGFSYSDVTGSANGWYNVIINNKILKEMFEKFRNRNDTFVLGVCNGCQLLCKLGWVNAQLDHNISGRFESRFSTVKINKSNNIFLKDMEDSILGIWIAHGEGRFISGQPVISYVNNDNISTIVYPFNPNGSINGCAAVSSDNGRCLAIMPHPERSFLKWQLPYFNEKINNYDNTFSPWMLLFQNAYKWCNLSNE